MTEQIWILDSDDYVETLVSTKTAWQRFHGCEPDYIAEVCKGRCCDAPTRPGGTLVTIHRSEQAAIEAAGGTVRDGFLVTDGRCTFKTDSHLCSLHFTPTKPFGCIASPFTFAPGSSRMLIVRNRYRMLPCYAGKAGNDGEDWPPAFVAFRASLDLIYGEAEAASLCRALEAAGDARADGYNGPGAFTAMMPRRSYYVLTDNDEAKRRHDTPT